ncbi:MAG: MarR family transcriptional regulator [Oscillospiraceae bacterium]|nr:MarR family transcriptional regulator [Oscillospiraceae bacterium]
MEKVDRKAVIRKLMSMHPLFRKKFLNRFDRPFGSLSKSQRDVVMSLNLYPAMNMGQLAVEANVSLQQITKTVNALEDMGYVRRYTDRANRRQVWVSLTEQCQADIRSSCDANDGLLVKSFASLSDEDMLQLQEAAQTITQIVNKMEDRPLQDLSVKDSEK